MNFYLNVMNYIDIIILLFLIYGAVRGFFKGLIIEVFTLLGLVLGVFLAMRYSFYAENILRDFLNVSEPYLRPVGLGVTFLLVVIVTYLLGKMLTKLVDVIALGMPNKLLGMLFGLLKYFVLICFVLMITDSLNETFGFLKVETQENSIFYRPFLNFATSMYNKIRF